MLTLNAQVLNTFTTPVKTGKDGQSYGGTDMVQLQGVNILPNGEKRIDLITLKTENLALFKDKVGKKVSVPIGAFAKDGSIVFYIHHGQKLAD